MYYGNQQRLEYDFVVSPGSDPKQIRFALEGVDHVAVDASSGDLVTQTDGSELRFLKPSIYQVDDARFSASAANKRTIDGQYVLLADNHIGFQIGPYDSAKPLIIDPVIGFFTYLGGMLPDVALHVAADASGVYLTGFTTSPDFPTSPAGGSTYHTAMCGSGANQANDTFATAIAVDDSGHAYLSGYTRSNSLPTTAGVVQPNAGGNSGQGGVQCHSMQSGTIIPCSDGFVARFDTTSSGSSSLGYATYLGGSYYDVATGIAIDAAGNAYVTGVTLSDDFPVVAAFRAARKPGRCGPFAGGPSGGHVCASAFVAKLNTTASALVYSSYLGGTGDTAAAGIALDSFANAYLTGATNASDFPTTSGVVQRSLATANCSYLNVSVTCPDAFVAKVSPTGALSYATFLGGTAADFGLGIAVDANGNTYVSGITNSTNFPTASALQSSLTSGNCTMRISGTPLNLTCPDAFLTAIDPSGGSLTYSTYLGGNNVDVATSLSLDPSSNLYVAGGTLSSGLATSGAYQTLIGSKGDAFVLKILAPSAPSFTLAAASGGSTSATVKDGQTATYNLQITPVGSFNGTVMFTCTGAPALATCAPPGPVSVTGTAPVPFSVTVSTVAAAGAPPFLWHTPSGRSPLWSLVTLVILLFLFAVRNRPGFPKGRSPLLWTAALFIISFSLLIGCSSGGGNSGESGSSTPLGSSPLTLTGTSGSMTQNLSLNLTVQ